jgi:hypothetical protein
MSKKTVVNVTVGTTFTRVADMKPGKATQTLTDRAPAGTMAETPTPPKSEGAIAAHYRILGKPESATPED